jgi:UDP-glucose 4-epimerase
MAKCLILGGNGFIGGHLVDQLVKHDHEVKVFDRFGTDFRNFEPSKKIEIIAGNFFNRADLGKALEDSQYVFHLVSTTTPATAENDPLIDIDTNVRMSIELFEECVAHKVKRIIFASTGGAIYGDVETGKPIDELTNPQPVSPYAIGKLTIEHYLRYFNRKFGIETLTFRISNPYGERHSPVNRQGVIPIFLHRIANDQPVTILGDGSMIRDYLYIGDVANLIAQTFQDAKQPLYNLASGQGVSINQLLDVIKKVTAKQIKTETKPKPPTFVQSVVLDINRFKDEFGLSPTTSLEDGISKTWEYVKQTL